MDPWLSLVWLVIVFVLMLALPLSFIGAFVALLLVHFSFDMTAMIGIILLMGLVTKNAILLVDFANVQRREGVPRRDAIIEAARVRLRPILMTSFAMIAGMVPMALALGEGGEQTAPLGRGRRLPGQPV